MKDFQQLRNDHQQQERHSQDRLQLYTGTMTSTSSRISSVMIKNKRIHVNIETISQQDGIIHKIVTDELYNVFWL